MAGETFPTIIMQDELTEEERGENRNAAAASVLQSGELYRFNRPVVTVPISAREKGTRDTWPTITIEQGVFLRWDRRFQWYIFSVSDHGVQRHCPVFFVHGLSVELIES